MNIYVTTDTHLNHTKLATVFKDRPMDFENRVLENHAVLEPDDYLIHLGDICMGRDEDMHKRWNTYTDHIKHRILVRGNHDKKSNSWYLSHGWDAISDQLVLKLYGKTLIFSHIPVDPKLWPATSLNIHGHTHGNRHRDFEIKDFYNPEYHREVALEHTDYHPILVTDKFLNTNKENTHAI